ncbi:hypothetical protein [Polaribacter sp.]|jgi:hypothetical protein|uniref:hypothetical protein n=1 Tax=Polaribacter sp. TaxID=1920175 RepID=UPI003F6B3598
MENTKIIFTGTENSESQELQLYFNSNNEIFIKVYDWETPEQAEFITLNKATAVKLCKVLKREISKIQ